MPSRAWRRPNQNHHAARQVASRHKASFPVVEASIFTGQLVSSEHLTRIPEIETPLAQRLVTLRRIEDDLQAIKCKYI
jgi:hypothetical protein